MLNPSLGGQPGNCNSLQQSKKRLLSKPRNLNRKEHELEVESIEQPSMNELKVKAKSKLKQIFSIKRQIVLIYAVCLLTALSMILLGNHILNDKFALDMDGNRFNRFARRSMAAVVPLKHVTQENFTSSNSTEIAVIYKSHSIFEDAG